MRKDRCPTPGALRALRERRGWSWADQARAIKYAAGVLRIPVARNDVSSLVRTIARWEREDGPVIPGDRYRLLLAYVFARCGDEVTVGAGSDFDQLMTLYLSWGVSAERVAELRVDVVRTVTPGRGLLAFLTPEVRHTLAKALATPADLTEDVVDDLRELVSDVNGQIGNVPFARLQMAITPAVEACRVLLDARPPQHLIGMLARVAANAYKVSARIAFETRDDRTSAELYDRALQTAEQLPSWERVAIRTSQALVTLYSTRDIGIARTMADAAVRDARHSDSRIMRARAHALHAEMAAHAGQDKHAWAALHLAWRDLDLAVDGDPAVGRFRTGHLDGFEGICNLRLGREREAEPQLLRSMGSLTHPRDAVQRAIVTADLAVARLHTQGPEAAAHLLHDCIDSADATGGRVPMLRIAEVRRALRPWRSETFMADLDDHLHDVLLAP